MRCAVIFGLSIGLSLSTFAYGEAPPIALVDSETSTEEVALKPGNVYVGQKITFNDDHTGDVRVRVGVWEADESRTYLENYPFTEYVYMISGRVVITNDDGSSNEFTAGDTFVIPRGFSGVWDIQERMKKQMVQIGDPTAKPESRPVAE
jgi:uncharacterized cupin superfamily protein